MPQKCPRCDHDAKLAFVTRDRNRRVSQEDFEYLRCLDCGLIFLGNIPDNLEAYYADSYYCAPKLEKLKKVAKAESYELEMVRSFIRGGRLLEVGPAFGVFAYQAASAGFDVEVIEKEGKCCDFLTQEIGVKAIRSDLPHKIIESQNPYDVIALWHVIEHLPFPWEFLEKAAQKLNDKGVLLVATPNPASFQFRFQGAAWPHIDAPRHVCLIPFDLLVKHMAGLGLKPVMVTFEDKGARSWNRFGWQRYLMNRFSGKLLQRAAFALGYLMAIPMGFWDRRKGAGSAYTVIFRKTAS